MPAKKKSKKMVKAKVKKSLKVKKTTKKATKKAKSKVKKITSPKKASTTKTKKTPKKKASQKAKKTKAKAVSSRKPKKTKSTVKAKIKTKAKTKSTIKSKPKAKTQTKRIAAPKKTKPVKSPVVAKKTTTKKVKEKKSMTEKSLEIQTAIGTTVGGAVDIAPYQLGKDEVYMNKAQIEHFRAILMSWRDQLMQEVDTTKVHMQQDAFAYADDLDRAAQEEVFTIELRTRDRERKLIKKIEQSLELLDKGEYGYCEDCGAEIGIRRLEARPTAEKCIDCKTYEEIREKQIGG